jgi:hypothetical protein
VALTGGFMKLIVILSDDTKHDVCMPDSFAWTEEWNMIGADCELATLKVRMVLGGGKMMPHAVISGVKSYWFEE